MNIGSGISFTAGVNLITTTWTEETQPLSLQGDYNTLTGNNDLNIDTGSEDLNL